MRHNANHEQFESSLVLLERSRRARPNFAVNVRERAARFSDIAVTSSRRLRRLQKKARLIRRMLHNARLRREGSARVSPGWTFRPTRGTSGYRTEGP